MKKCPNPKCEPNFVYPNSDKLCPICNTPLVKESTTNTRTKIQPPDRISMKTKRTTEKEVADKIPDFIIQNYNSIECTGRVTEIEHQALFFSSFRKWWNSVFRSEPFQLAHQTLEYLIRVEDMTDNYPNNVTDFCLYGNYLGRLQVGDEVVIRAKDRVNRKIVKKIINKTTDTTIKPGAQIPAWLVRLLTLIILALLIALVYYIIYFFSSGLFLAVLKPIIVVCLGIFILFKILTL